MKPGFYQGISAADYDRIPALRSSTLKLLDTHTPAHVKYNLEHGGKSSAAMQLGTAAHLAILEPDQFDEVVKLSPFSEYRSAEAKAWVAKTEADGHIPLKKAAYESIMAMRDGVYANPFCKGLLQGEGQNEITLVWEESEILCKCRFDRVTEWNGEVTMVDVKTVGGGPGGAANLRASRIVRAAETYGWHLQQVWYSRGMDALFGAQHRPFLFVCVEKDMPHFTAPVMWDFQSLERTKVRVGQLLSQYRNCTVSNAWPAYTGVQEMELSKWALPEVE